MTSTVKINCLWCPNSGGVCVGGGGVEVYSLNLQDLALGFHCMPGALPTSLASFLVAVLSLQQQSSSTLQSITYYVYNLKASKISQIAQ